MAKAGWKKAQSVTEGQESLLPKSLSSEQKQVCQAEAPDQPFRGRRLDPISDRLGCHEYMHKMRWSWFRNGTAPLEVSRYYMTLKLAIDIAPEDTENTKIKNRILSEQGITYKVLANSSDFKSLLDGVQ
jgi:hypothetical protein